MKLIQQITLLFDDGRTEKIYEIDLCEVGPTQFVVNFRFGPKGGTLRDGSKTVVPVPETEARRIYDKMVQRQMGKGFYDAKDPKPKAAAIPSAAAPSTASKSNANFTKDPGLRNQTLAQKLTAKTRWQKNGSEWALPKAAFRAGVAAAQETSDALLGILADPATKADQNLMYSTLWSLARLGSTDAALAKKLEPMLKDGAHDYVLTEYKKPADNRIARVAAHAFSIIASDAEGDAFQKMCAAGLPTEIQNALSADLSDDVFRDTLRAHWGQKTDEHCAPLDVLQLVENEQARLAVLDFASEAPLRPPYFRRLRHLYKMAELQGDGELFGIIARRFAKVPAMYTSSPWGDSTHYNGQYIRSVKTESASPNAQIAYSSKTRWYLRRRTWRTLRKYAELDQAEAYVKMAVGVLLPFVDADKRNARRTSRYDYSSRRSIETHYDGWAGYWAFNHILHGHSPRMELPQGSKFWVLKRGVKPGDKSPNIREESYPHFWDAMPEGLLHLLLESECEDVHEFAFKAIKGNDAFLQSLPVEVLCDLLKRPYIITSRLAFELAEKHHDDMNPNLDLISAMANAPYQKAREFAFEAMNKNRIAYTASANFIVSLLLSDFKDTTDAASTLLQGAALSDEVGQAVIGRLIAHLVASTGSDAAEVQKRTRAGEILLKNFPREVRTISIAVVMDLIDHPQKDVQALGAQLLLGHDTKAQDLPETLITRLMNSEFPEVRTVGIRLFGELPDDLLKERTVILVGLCTSEKEDVRSAIHPVIVRLAAADEDFAADVATLFVRNLLRKERYQGVHNFLLLTLKRDLKSGLAHINEEIVYKLLQAESSAAQDLGGELLKTNVDAAALTLRRIAVLSSHDILSVRQAAWHMIESQRERAIAEIGDTIRLLDAKWPDSREWAFEFFKSLPKDAFDPKTLVAICDSTRPQVQSFGQGLITQYFEDAHGSEYLLKLAEHPSQNVQLFVTNYLARYAEGDVEKMRKLRHYFLAILSRVNMGRVAKARVMHFLRAESLKSEELAIEVAQILSRQSATVAVMDKAQHVEAMVDVRTHYPDVALPITIKPIPERQKERRVRGGV